MPRSGIIEPEFHKQEIDAIYENYIRYMATDCLSGEEDAMEDVLVRDFDCQSIKGCPVWLGNPDSNIMYVTHMDRIPLHASRNEKIVYDSVVPYIQGQLDNTISIACLKTLKDFGYTFNVIFTREEEICQPHMFVIPILVHIEKELNGRVFHDWALIDTDIDVFYRNDEWVNSVSLREEDNVFRFTSDLVKDFRNIARTNKINYSTKNDWLVGSIGLIRQTGHGKTEKESLDGLYLGLPILNYHSEAEIVSIESLQAYYDMMLLTSNFNFILGSEREQQISLFRDPFLNVYDNAYMEVEGI